jgi:hypothetical protein
VEKRKHYQKEKNKNRKPQIKKESHPNINNNSPRILVAEKQEK